jgi:hypothetical protein
MLVWGEPGDSYFTVRGHVYGMRIQGGGRAELGFTERQGSFSNLDVQCQSAVASI